MWQFSTFSDSKAPVPLVLYDLFNTRTDAHLIYHFCGQAVLYDHDRGRISCLRKDDSDPRALAYVYENQDSYSLFYIKMANLVVTHFWQSHQCNNLYLNVWVCVRVCVSGRSGTGWHWCCLSGCQHGDSRGTLGGTNPSECFPTNYRPVGGAVTVMRASYNTVEKTGAKTCQNEMLSDE